MADNLVAGMGSELGGGSMVAVGSTEEGSDSSWEEDN